MIFKDNVTSHEIVRWISRFIFSIFIKRNTLHDLL